MATKYYGHGAHPGGFIGFKVNVSFGEKKYQEYFSTSDALIQDSSDYHYEVQRLSALIQEAKWKLESLAYQYNKFVTANHALTKPGRGIGVHCITLDFITHNDSVFYPVFDVTIPGQGAKRISLKTKLYSEAWKEAVDTWAQAHTVLDTDKDRLLANPPSPQRFKELRRQMNSEGKDVGVEALSMVFREQRMALEAQRDRAAGSKISKSLAAPVNIDTQVAGEMMSWLVEQKEAFSLKKG